MTDPWPDWMTYESTTIKKAGIPRARRKTKVQAARDVLTAINGIALIGPTGGVVWRGQADISWRLQSKAARAGMTPAEVVKHETAMINEARIIGADGAQHMGDWEILAKMRHHGAATRLIDVTRDPLIALWFLCDDDAMVGGKSVRDQTGILLALQRESFRRINNPQKRDSYRELVSKGKDKARLMYSTPPIDPRIAAQRGSFLLHSHPVSEAESSMSELGDFTQPSTGNWMADSDDALEKICGPVMSTDRGPWCQGVEAMVALRSSSNFSRGV
ncbi:FRG domain-containing protein [Sanguibacter antarcticus]|uniref:FRG domain-containing protein n=1 Tax=Sanguibacter antarcticus TaxID=372484 RepID=A0A2A9E1Z7_9MICO|nr:FRG domain-containing protein [Sanguibacter antarcticus]PFG32385.1 FRG domain-containing protein [Sanguibacter antarcticus]